jgi:flagellar basal-body rod modification protein FlgD
MSSVGGVNANSTSPSSSSSQNSSIQSAVQAATGLTSQQFMQLLVAQVQYQDPLDPMSDADFASQLAQFASLEGIEQLNTNFSNLLLMQELTQGSSLVGMTLQYQPTGSSTASQGTVQQVTFQNGQLQLIIGGTAVSLSQVVGIVPNSSTASTGSN